MCSASAVQIVHSTKRNLKTREDSDVLTKRWIILPHTDCWNKCQEYQNVGRDSGLHEGKGTKNNGTERVRLNGQKSDMFEMKMGTKQGDLLFSFLFNTVLQMALNDDVERWQKTKGMGIRLRDQESECLTNLRYYLSGRVRNILGKNYVSATGNSKDQKIESEPPGHRSTDASKS